jgi:hypothetical protein
MFTFFNVLTLRDFDSIVYTAESIISLILGVIFSTHEVINHLRSIHCLLRAMIGEPQKLPALTEATRQSVGALEGSTAK